MSNTKLWDMLYKTDPSAVKPITGKQYQGNSPKPYWIVGKVTEVLGPCGIGWGIRVSHERFERLTDDDVLHVALVEVWYEFEGKTGVIQQMGQTKAVYKTSKGTLMVDEDAPKKSVTDGMVKCLSMIGAAGDIFSGRWDDSKYVEEQVQRERSEKDPAITDEQFKSLNALLDQAGADKVAFCSFFAINSVKEMKQSSLSKATQILNDKIAKAKGGQK